MGVIITGGSGFVGSQFLEVLSRQFSVLAPSHTELNVTNASQVADYFKRHTPSAVIHAAAFTDNDAAEGERGNKKGLCWQVNVDGTRNIVDAAAQVGAFVINISTGSVFAGDEKMPGPFNETDSPSSQEKLSWYAYTKAVAETLITYGATIRLSHPVADTPLVAEGKTDYVHQLVSLYDDDTLYPLFTDQRFGITYLPDVILAIKTILRGPAAGFPPAPPTKGTPAAGGPPTRVTPTIYHIVSVDRATPYEIVQYAIEKARYVRPSLKATTFDEFIKTVPMPKRYAKYHAIDGLWTRKILQLPSRTWKEIVDCLYPAH